MISSCGGGLSRKYKCNKFFKSLEFGRGGAVYVNTMSINSAGNEMKKLIALSLVLVSLTGCTAKFTGEAAFFAPNVAIGKHGVTVSDGHKARTAHNKPAVVGARSKRKPSKFIVSPPQMSSDTRTSYQRTQDVRKSKNYYGKQ